MTLRKMMLLASMALAVVAFTAPAAQATGPTISGAETYEGILKFKVLISPIAGSTFACQVTVRVEGTGNTTAHITEFEPTTTECEGTGFFENCQLKEHENNAPWVAHSDTDHTLTVTPDVTIKNVYEGMDCLAPSSHLEFGAVTVTPTPTEGAINTLSVHSLITNTAVTAEGTLHKESAGFSDLTLTT